MTSRDRPINRDSGVSSEVVWSNLSPIFFILAIFAQLFAQKLPKQ